MPAAANDSREASRERRARYGLLLLAIVASFALQGIATPGKVEQILITALLATTLLLALWAANASPLVMRSMLVVAVAVVAFSVVEAVTGHVAGAGTRIANMLLVVLAPPAIVVGVVRTLRARGRVTVEAVFGVLCLYILLGMFFAFAYGTIDRLAPPFFAQDVQATVARCLYFSFTTLTTVGYGDLTAASNLGHTLSNAEALIGQIYLVTIVSVIVGNLSRAQRGPAGAQRSP
jgi:Ion channel